MKEDYPLFVEWSKTLDWILDVAEKYPKSVRFTLSGRIANLGLDVLEGIIEAIYSRNRVEKLKSINLCIEKLRVLFRISHQRRYISTKQYEYISQRLDESGRMVGGWRKADEARGKAV